MRNMLGFRRDTGEIVKTGNSSGGSAFSVPSSQTYYCATCAGSGTITACALCAETVNTYRIIHNGFSCCADTIGYHDIDHSSSCTWASASTFTCDGISGLSWSLDLNSDATWAILTLDFNDGTVYKWRKRKDEWYCLCANLMEPHEPHLWPSKARCNRVACTIRVDAVVDVVTCADDSWLENTSGVVAENWNLTVSGLSNDTCVESPGCTKYNATHSITWAAVSCSGGDATAGVCGVTVNPIVTIKRSSDIVGDPYPDKWVLQFGASGGSNADYSIPKGDFDGLNANTFDLETNTSQCTGWPSTLTIYPSA